MAGNCFPVTKSPSHDRPLIYRDRETCFPVTISYLGNQFPSHDTCFPVTIPRFPVTIVTVTATAHGITTGSTYVGCRYFYPGSPSLAAGWYDSILTVPDANTLTFSATGADFGSESVNGGAAYTTATDINSLIIPGNSLKDQSKVRLVHLRDGDAVATNKTIALVFGGSALSLFNATSSSRGDVALGFRCLGLNKQIASNGVNEYGMTSGALNSSTKDITQDQTLTLRATCTAARLFIAVQSAHVEIIY